MALHQQLVFNSIEAINYVEGVPLFDQRLAKLQNDQGYDYQTIFKLTYADLLIKITNKHISAKISLHIDEINLVEFTSHETHHIFTIYVQNDRYEKIVFKLTNSATNELKEFFDIHKLQFVENIQLETPQKIAGYGNSGNGIYNVIVFLIIVVIAVGLYYLFTAVDLRDVASSGIFRLLLYIGVIASLIIGVFSRLR